MAMEDAINRLARAVELQGEGVAVREIIRQRDAALTDLAQERKYHAWTKQSLDAAHKREMNLARQTSALRGVITRMKRKAEAR